MALTRIPDNLIPWRRTPAGQDVSAPRAPRDAEPDRVGADNGAEHGVRVGEQAGSEVGTEHGTQVGIQAGPDDGDDLGFRLVRHDGAWIGVDDEEPYPVGAGEHAEAFLEWLQETQLAGDWVALPLLIRLYQGRFMEDMHWAPEAWPSVARHLRRLPGVKVRQRDGRRGPGRHGKARTDYWIPKPRRCA